MQRSNYLFTSESVSEGHPDKVCDQISDAILDVFIENDLKLGIADESKVNTRLGCETLCTTNKIVIAGEGRGQAPLFHKHGDKAVVNRELIAETARQVVKDIGYDQDGFSYYGADVEVLSFRAQTLTQNGIGGGHFGKAAFERAEIQAGATDQQRHVATRGDGLHRDQRIVAELRRRIRFRWIADIDQRVRVKPQRCGIGLGRADVQPAIHQRRIDADEFNREPIEQRTRQRGLAGGRRPHQEDRGRSLVDAVGQVRHARIVRAPSCGTVL